MVFEEVQGEAEMIDAHLKLRLTKAQECRLNEWLFILTGVYNWAIRKIELDAADGIYHSDYDLEALARGHSKKIGVPAHVIRATIYQAHNAWRRTFKKLTGKPKL